MDDENDELRDDIERVRGIDEGEAGRRIGEFRDIVGRIEDLSAQLAAHNDAVRTPSRSSRATTARTRGRANAAPRSKTMTLTTSQPATGMIWPTSSISKEV